MAYILAALLVVVCGLSSPALAGDSVSIPGEPSSAASDRPAALFGDIPQDVKPIAPLIQRTVSLFQSRVDAEHALRSLRSQQDGLTTKLTAVNGELELLAATREQAQQQLTALESEQQAKLEALRKELESKLEQELADAGRQMSQENEQDLARRVQSFEGRQRDEIQRSLNQEIQLQERDLAQLKKEVEMQTEELQGRLGRLDISPEAMAGLAKATNDALAKRTAALEARRKHLEAERDERLSRSRATFVERSKQQQAAESQRRLTVKEASLRQAMAELLHATRIQEGSRVEQARHAVEETGQRYSELAQEQASLRARTNAASEEIASQAQRIEGLGAEQEASFARLEEAFSKPRPELRGEAIAWFGRVIEQLPPELASELGALQQRIALTTEQERQLQEQQRVLRERQLAMQVAHEMEAKRQRALLEQQRDQEAKARKADELLSRAMQLGERGRFDEALQSVSQAQGLGPPQMSAVTSMRETLLTAKAQAESKAKAAELEQLFAQAMQVFEQGRYEEAVTLFEKVIAQESAMENSSVQFADTDAP